MLSLEDARERLSQAIKPLGTGRGPLISAHRKYAAETAKAFVDLPLFDNSAMDGYAVRAQDLKAATQSTPIILSQIGRIGAGEILARAVSAGECVRIFTGSALPKGADAVVMQEDVTADGEQIYIFEPVKPLENVRLKGEDIRAGAVILQPGEWLDAAKLALLAATGHPDVETYREARVAVLSTGSELVQAREFGGPLPDGKIYESNLTMLTALLRDINIEICSAALVADTLEKTVSGLAAAFENTNDFVITTGGVSVGEFDFVKEAFEKLGGKLEFWKVAIRPGKPFVHGTLGDKHLFGLPGNPVSALVTFLLLVRPALLKAMGARNLELPRLKGELEERLVNRGDRRHFVRARWWDGKIRVAGRQSSHMIASLGEANCLIDVPPQTQIDAGEIVSAQIWQCLGK